MDRDVVPGPNPATSGPTDVPFVHGSAVDTDPDADILGALRVATGAGDVSTIRLLAEELRARRHERAGNVIPLPSPRGKGVVR